MTATCKTLVDMQPINVARALGMTIILCFHASPAAETRVMVFAAASLTESLREIAGDYGRICDDKLVFNFGGSSTLARQIEEGAPADLFFCADEVQMDRLQAKRIVTSRTNLLSNTLVIVVAAEEGAAVTKPQDLATPAIRRIALGDPKAVPIGVYARGYLQQEGLWEAVSPKVVATESVRAALAAVESGNAEASIVYKTDALVSRRVKMAYEVPGSKNPMILYPVAVVKDAKNKNGAENFLRYLASPPCRTVFIRHGFIALQERP